MKKVLIILASIFLLLIVVAIAVPILFKDDIKAAVDDVLAESVNADIVWDTDDFSLSLLSNFPNVTAGMNNFGVINRAPFEGQILFAVQELEVEVDLFSLMGDQIKINGIRLNSPEIFIHVLEDGSANYDIAIATEEMPTTPAPASEEATAYNIGIDHWEITNGHIVYDDATLPFKLEIKELQHSGNGDLNQDEFDLNTKTKADSVTVIFDGVEYLSDKNVAADVIINISDEFGRYTFKENRVSVNDFALSFDGFLALLADGSMDMDINYAAPESSFKSLLSLVPGIYTQEFSDIQSEGTLSFEGKVSGTYDSLNLPAFNVALKVDEAMFKYPDLPTSIDNIKMDLLVDNADGNIDNTIVDLKSFHMDFGNNPIDASLRVENLVNYKMKANVQGKLNLGELSSMFPMEGTMLKGNYVIDLTANGIYDSIKNTIPTIAANMSLTNGYVKSSEFPYALEDLHFDAVVKNETGNMDDLHAVVKDFAMTMDGEPFKADLTFSDLANYTWDLKASGGIDLEKITKVFPLEGMELSGKIEADLDTKGNMASLEAEKYDQLPTSGKVTITGFKYVDSELPYDVTISTAAASFDPQKITIESYKGTVGKSDMNITGSVSNYMAYLFGENQTLNGTMNYDGKLLDLNEFMEEEETASGPTMETTPAEGQEEVYGVIEVPKNIEFLMKSTIAKVEVMDMTLTNIVGDIVVEDGIASFKNVNFNLLEGAFAMNGSYNTQNLDEPKYDFNLDIKDLSIQKSFSAFSLVQTYAPVARLVNGSVSTDFNVSGLLNDEMLPDLGTVTGGGLLKIAQASLSDSKIIQSVTALTKLKSSNSSSAKARKVTLKDVLMSATIEDGKLKVDPFDFKLGDYNSTVSGATSLDGGISYNLKMDIPASDLGSQFGSLVSSFGGGSGDDAMIPIKIGIGGTYDNPKPQLLMDDQKQQAKAAVKDKAKEEAKDLAGDLLDNVKSDKAKDLVSGLLGGDEKDSSSTQKADSTQVDLKKQLEDEAKDAIKNLFRKKKKN
ncbi:AsmA family protein [Fulvivirga sp. M361]|uniref:AsmA family protein n=1 Tax=Fulvivirga sp. M361 TaxID=2594266 RepID=UPI00117AA555|nr:AsmA family protein [Fulvivirga sp. M361]TRX58359.1 AsmA family protein [Fulvivirga sp. M361]